MMPSLDVACLPSEAVIRGRPARQEAVLSKIVMGLFQIWRLSSGLSLQYQNKRCEGIHFRIFRRSEI